ncbi:hypothetical protein BD626DRAFT_452828 [Schizophyllum amplum]|uniref:Pentacotripeptide-repeat region of PRORP domain-containing protein n=1 Tax=Schizophyllum amplum TaxID=97359 RepID=A0A550CLK1_9AGAR|nr:hypothetical protein BD626DRAFT_452828 [Auriculariopsis ampla]
MLKRFRLVPRQLSPTYAARALAGCSNLLSGTLLASSRLAISVRCATAAALRRDVTWFSSGPPEPAAIPRPRATSPAAPPMPASQDLPEEMIAEVQWLLEDSQDMQYLMRRVQDSEPLSDVFLQQDKARRIATALANTQSPAQANRAIMLAHKMGANLKQNAYEGAAHAHAYWKEWRLVLEVVALGLKQEGKTTARLLNWKIMARSALRHYSKLRTALDEFDEHHVKPNLRTFHLLIIAHIQNHDLKRASHVLQRMEDYGFTPDPSTHAVILTAYRDLGTDARLQDRVLESLSELPVPLAVSVLNSCMQLRLDARDLGGAAQLLLYFDHDLVAPIYDVLTGSPVMPPPPHDHKAYPPDVQTFIIYINQAAARDDLERGLQVFDGMRAANIEPDVNVVVSLLHLHFTSGEQEVALELMRRMCKRGTSKLFPRKRSSTIDVPLDTTGITPTIKVFNAFLRGMMQLRGVYVFNDVLALMRANGVIPNESTLEILMSYLDKEEAAPPRVLMRLAGQFTAEAELRPTLRQAHIILSAILREEKSKAYSHGWQAVAAQVKGRSRRKMQAKIVDWMHHTDSTLHIKKSRYVTNSLLRWLRRRGVQGNGTTLALRMRHEALTTFDLNIIHHLFHELLVRGIRPNAHHFAALMEGYAANGDVAAAHDVLRAARKAEVELNVVMYTILISGYARAGKPHVALRTLEEMQEVGVQPDVPAIDAVVSAFYATGDLDVARRVLVGLWRHIGEFPEEMRDTPLTELARYFRSLHTKTPQRILTSEEKRELDREVDALKKAVGRELCRQRRIITVAQTSESDGDPS